MFGGGCRGGYRRYVGDVFFGYDSRAIDGVKVCGGCCEEWGGKLLRYLLCVYGYCVKGGFWGVL